MRNPAHALDGADVEGVLRTQIARMGGFDFAMGHIAILMAMRAVQERALTVRTACVALGVSETCYRYRAGGSAQNEIIVDWLVKLTHNLRNWGFGLCFLYLRNVKGFGWNHSKRIPSTVSTV